MPDYRKMYITMVQETEKAINILTEAQKKCEELYVNAPENSSRMFTVVKGESDS